MSASVLLSFSSTFDGGNGTLLSARLAEGCIEAVVAIRPDVHSQLEDKTFMQWFSFRCSPGSDNKCQRVRYMISNAASASYPKAWAGTTVCFSYDAVAWQRCLDTSFDTGSGVLSWTFDHSGDGRPVHFSYFATYPYERVLALVARCGAVTGTRVRTLGHSLQGREVSCITCGTGPLVAWIIHRQHPGETQGSFFCEGLLRRLLGIGSDSSVGAVDGLAMRLKQQYTLHIVPLVCPDGAVLGHLRTNACGANLNREWADTDAAYAAPSAERSPEVLCVLRAMDASGCDAFVDVHGDEVRPFVFLSGSEGMAVWGPRLKALHGAFLAAYARANPDIQAEIGYDADPAGEGDARIASNQVAQRFNCMSVTLEMPYKDCASNPDASRGWSSDRCALLGASLVDALSYVQPFVRHAGNFWETLPSCDAYVSPRDIDGLPTHELNS